MGNSVSCFERVSEHPPYSWPKDHPDRERAIAERKRARHNMKLAEKQARGRTGTQQVQPEPAAAPQPKADSKEVVEAAPVPQKPVEEPKVAEVPEEETTEEVVKTGETADAAEGVVEEKVDEVKEDVMPDKPAEEVAEKELDLIADEVTAEPKAEAVEKESEAAAVAIVSETLEEAEPTDEKKDDAEVDAAVVDEVVSVEAVDNVEKEEREIVDDIVEVKEVDDDVIIPVNIEDEEPKDDAPEVEPEPVQGEPEKELELAPVEEFVKEEPELELAADEEFQEPTTEADTTSTTPIGPDGVVKEVKPDLSDEELPSIESRRAMFDTTEDELPKAADMNRDVYDAASNEYITLEEYRRRQRERAQGLVKERLEKYEEIDEEVSKEKAELAAIVAARSVAQQTADWAYKQQPDKVSTPTKDPEGVIKEIMSPEVPLSPSAGSVAGISAKFEADVSDMPPTFPLLGETKVVSDGGDVDAINASVEPEEVTETVEDIIAAKSDVAVEVTDRTEIMEGATTETVGVAEKVNKVPETVTDAIPASMEDVAKKSAEVAETEGNTIQVPPEAES